MPFVAHGSAPNFEPKEFCCLMIEGKWKLHHFENGMWKRIDTSLPYDATECSPTAEYDSDSNKWKVSFIAGGYEADRKFYLYKVADLENPKLEKIVQAEVGFIFKNRIVHARCSGDIVITDDMQIKTLKLTNVEYLYRLSFNPNNPNELLISGQDFDGKLFSWVCNVRSNTLFEIYDNSTPAYKACLFNDECFYAKRNDSDGFEDRHIIKASNFKKEQLDFDSCITVSAKDNIPTNFDMAKNFASSITRFAKSGFKLADDETLKSRNDICSSCEFWQSTARLGLGKCLKCGCTSAKLFLRTESCPIKKW